MGQMSLQNKPQRENLDIADSSSQTRPLAVSAKKSTPRPQTLSKKISRTTVNFVLDLRTAGSLHDATVDGDHCSLCLSARPRRLRLDAVGPEFRAMV